MRFDLILDSFSKHGIEVDNETADAMQRDQKSFSLSYTYTQLFVEKVLKQINLLMLNLLEKFVVRIIIFITYPS